MHQNSSSRGGQRASQRSGRSQGQGSQGHSQGQGHSHGNGNGNGPPGAAPPFKLLTRLAPQDGDGNTSSNNNSPRSEMSPGLGLPLQQQSSQFAGYSQYGYPVPPQQLHVQTKGGKAMSRMPQSPMNPTFLTQQPGLGGAANMSQSANMNTSGPGSVVRSNSVPGGIGQGQRRRERSNSIMGSQFIMQSPPQQHQQLKQLQDQELVQEPEQEEPDQEPDQEQHYLPYLQVQQHHSDAGGSDPDATRDSKPRRERRARSRRDRASRQPQSELSKDDISGSSGNEGSLKHQQQQQQQVQQQQQPLHRVIVDPNSFHRQILQPNPNSSGGGERRDIGEPHDDDSQGIENRRPVSAGRTVYSWQGSNQNQQQQHQQQQQQQQEQQHQHHQQQALRGPMGPYSQPGFKEPRLLGVQHSAGAAVSVGGRPTQNAPIVAIPPSMGPHSVKLMNEHGKILESAEQVLDSFMAFTRAFYS